MKGRLYRMLCLMMLVPALSGCEALGDLTGRIPGKLRLLVYAVPRRPPGAELPVSQVVLEAVQGGYGTRQDIERGRVLLCARLSAELGGLSEPGGPTTEQGPFPCRGRHCLLPLPSGRPHRAVAIYTPAQGSIGDLLTAELFRIPVSKEDDGAGAPDGGATEEEPLSCLNQPLGPPITVTTLVLGVMDSPVPDLLAVDLVAPSVPPQDAGTEDSTAAQP